MENTGLEPANAENNALADAAPVDTGADDASGADPAPAAAETGKPDTRDKVQERFDKLTREKYEGLSRAERAEYRAQMLEQQLAQFQAQAQTPTVAPSNDYPSLESVGYDEAKHATAVAAWSAKQARDAARAELQAERESATREQTYREWERKQAEFIKSKPDYVEKVGSLPPSLMTNALADEIKASPMGPEVAYYLSENLDKLAAIKDLPARQQAREIGRIEARLEALKAAPPPVSKAPPPPAKIESAASTGAADPTSPDSDKMSADEWLKRRVKQVHKLNQR